MNPFKLFLITSILLLLLNNQNICAQDVFINVPVSNISGRTEFSIQKNVMNTQGNTIWRAGAINPTIKAEGMDQYRHTTLPSEFLPSEILHWRLASIGGQIPPFPGGGSWPGFKWFTTSYQTWFHPTVSSKYPAGNIDFTFKIPAAQFAQRKFLAGDYSMEVIHNYGPSGFYVIEFSPHVFNVLLSIPPAISWISNNNSKYITISSLADYRNIPAQVVFDLGISEIFHTLDFNLWAKSSSSTIQFTSSKGLSGTKDISLIELGSTNPKINSLPLSVDWKNHNSSNNSFLVSNGNRTSFPLTAKISASNFKDQFFAAGTYHFQLNLDAKSAGNPISSFQNTDVILKVLALSEISIPSLGNMVNFDFNTAAKYQNGDTKIIPNQLRVSNNETYELYVKSDVSFFKRSGIQTDIPSSILQVSIEGSPLNVALSTTSQKILNNGTPVLDKDLNIQYKISPAAAQSLVSKEKSIYSINVIYSFTAL